MALLIRYFTYGFAFALAMMSLGAFARTVPLENRSLTGDVNSHIEGSFETAKMSDHLKDLIYTCIGKDLPDRDPTFTARRCINIIKGVNESQNGALGASLILKKCVHQTHSRNACENMVKRLVSFSKNKNQPQQTAYASQLTDTESTGAR